MRLNEIYQSYKDRIAFFCVYIKEVHPEDNVGGYQTRVNIADDVRINQPTTIEERAQVAGMCMLGLNLEMPMLLDDMTNQVDEKYIAEPDRLYVVDADGLLHYISAPGPYGFDVDAWEAAIGSLPEAADTTQ